MLLLCFSLFCVWVSWDNHRTKISRYKLSTLKTNEHITIGHLSDIHDEKLSDTVIKALRTVDVIFITGDMIDGKIDVAESNLQKLTTIAPVYFVSGNHEIANSEYSKFKEMARKHGVKLLENKTAMFNNIGISGLCEEKRYEISKLKGKGKYKILLAHHPEDIGRYTEFDLVFCGHAHGGQVRIPLIGGLYSPGQGLFPKYTKGIYEYNDTTMIVNSGYGGPKPRINNPSEVCIITIN